MQTGVLIVLIPFAVLTGCGDDGGTCVEGRTLECACPGGVAGIQQCTADGTFAECACPGMDSGAITDAGDSSATDSARDTTVDPVPRICAVDGDCEDGDACTFDDCNEATRLCEYSPSDRDGDGDPAIVCGGDDCDDANVDVYSGGPELCDGLDNNCGSGGGRDPTEDGDDDGFVASDASCNGGPLPKTDCDDTDGTSFPGATEVCDSADNDCDATIDEDADRDCYLPGTFRVCEGGSCVLRSCLLSYSDCNGVRADGCETNLDMDDGNCGACGTSCGPGLACCGGRCVDLSSSWLDCGVCGTECRWNSDRCRVGVCVCGPGGFMCSAGAVCDGVDCF